MNTDKHTIRFYYADGSHWSVPQHDARIAYFNLPGQVKLHHTGRYGANKSNAYYEVERVRDGVILTQKVSNLDYELKVMRENLCKRTGGDS